MELETGAWCLLTDWSVCGTLRPHGWKICGEKTEPFNTSGFQRGFAEQSDRCNVCPQHFLSDYCITDIWSNQQLSLKFGGATEGRKDQKKMHVECVVTDEWIKEKTTELEKEWDWHTYTSTYLYVCVSDCVCVMFACIHGRVCVCTPLLQGSGQTAHSCGGTQAKRL